MRVFLVLLILVLVLVAVFALQNPGIITISFLNQTARTSLLAVIIGAFAAGFVAALLAGIPPWYRNRRRLREAQKEAADLRRKQAEASFPGMGPAPSGNAVSPPPGGPEEG
jgi:uncharacterized integral membrane protein